MVTNHGCFPKMAVSCGGYVPATQWLKPAVNSNCIAVILYSGYDIIIHTAVTGCECARVIYGLQWADIDELSALSGDAMEDFFTDVLDRLTAPHFLEVVQSKYHYRKGQLNELKSVAEQLQPLMRREACWNQGEFPADVPKQWQVCAEGPFREVVLTLGEGVDLLQEEFSQGGLFSECYMVEALAGELLLQGYAAYNRNVAECSEFHVARYYFPGSCDEFPLKLLEEMLERLKMPVRCNEAFCMIPKKSVAFVAGLTRDVTRRCQGICVGCNSRNCPNRIEEGMNQSRTITNMADKLLNYGYSKIFGRR